MIKIVETDQLYIIADKDGDLDSDRVFDNVASARDFVEDGEKIVTLVPNDWVGEPSDINVYGTGYITMQHEGKIFSDFVNKSGIMAMWFAKQIGISNTAFSYYRMGIHRVPYLYKNFIRDMVLVLNSAAAEWRERNGRG